MKLRIGTFLATCLMLTLVAASAFASDQPAPGSSVSSKPGMGGPGFVGIKQRLAVLPLRYQVDVPGPFQLALNEMLTDTLFHTGRFVVVERKDTDRIMQEQALGQSGAVTSQTAAHVGKLLGAEILVDGAITQYAYNSSGHSSGISFGGVSFGGGNRTATLVIAIRLMDANTGEIIASQTATGKAEGSSAGFSVETGDLSFHNSAFNRSPLGKATRQAIDAGVKFIVDQIGNRPWEGRVADLDGSGGSVTLYINGGSRIGLQAGYVLEVFRPGQEITDPATGEVIGHRQGQTIGQCRIQSVTDTLATAASTTGEGFRKGDAVRLISRP